MKKGKFQEILPIGSDDTKVLYQSNRITNGKWRGFTLLQSKIFISIMDALQDAIKADMRGDSGKQLELFDVEKDGLLKIEIPLKDIAKPSQYKDIFINAKELASITLEFESKDNSGNKYKSVATLFHRFDVPELKNGLKVMNVFLHQESAKKLIEVDKNIHNAPINFTKYLKRVGMKAKNKYTYKLYMIISSWKSKGGFRISFEALKEQLGIGEGQYKLYNRFKERVLVPVQEELKENGSDCWFNCSGKDFEEVNKKTGKVIYLNFKIITKSEKEMAGTQSDYIRFLLRTHFSFTQQQLDNISSIFSEDCDYSAIQLKIMDLAEYISNPENNIGNKQSYVTKSLLNAFS